MPGKNGDLPVHLKGQECASDCSLVVGVVGVVWLISGHRNPVCKSLSRWMELTKILACIQMAKLDENTTILIDVGVCAPAMLCVRSLALCNTPFNRIELVFRWKPVIVGQTTLEVASQLGGSTCEGFR